MQEKFKDFQILHGREEKVNPKLTAYQVELARVEAEIEKLLDTLTGANATLLAYANKKIEELDTRRQTISKAIAELSVETISPQQIKKLSYYLDNWDSIDFDDKRKAADGLISTIKATSDHVQIEWKSDISALSPSFLFYLVCTPCTSMFASFLGNRSPHAVAALRPTDLFLHPSAASLADQCCRGRAVRLSSLPALLPDILCNQKSSYFSR